MVAGDGRYPVYGPRPLCGVPPMNKLCKDCKWVGLGFFDYLLGGFSYTFAKCAHPDYQDNGGDLFVTGRKKDGSHYCSTARMFDCGKDGKGWEPK